MSSTQIVAVISTYRRRVELDRLIKSLLNGRLPVNFIVVNDDANEEAVRTLVSSFNIESRYIFRPPQPGNTAATGWNRALDEAVRCFGAKATHYLLIDDDAVVEHETLSELYEAQALHGSKSSFPAALNPSAMFYVTSMLCEPRWEDAQKRCKTRADLLREFAEGPCKAWMFQGLCHLMHRDVVLSGIRFDENFWLCGEDLDFSVRVAEQWASVFVPKAFCWHLWGAPFSAAGAKNSNYLKRLSYLQNVTFMGYWRPYGKKLRGRYFDFLRGKGLWPAYRTLFNDFGISTDTVMDLTRIIFYAMVCREASNQPRAQRLRQRRAHYLVV